MYELWHIGIGYAIGTAIGIALFKEFVKEKIITSTIDSLATQGYLYVTEGPDGMVMLTKVDEVVEAAVTEIKVEAIIKEADEIQKKLWEDDDAEDDTP